MVLITQKALDFTSPAVIGINNIVSDFNFFNFINNHMAILFFWPMDFTFVCPSEIISFNKRFNEFKKRNVKIIGVSCDSQFVHNIWQNTDIKKGGIGSINYPMVADIKKNIIKKYNVEHPNLGIPLRASYLIDKNKIIRHLSINDLPIGRNIDEIIRIIDAFKFYKKYNEVCPAQWKKGDKGIIPTKKGISEYLTLNYKKL